MPTLLFNVILPALWPYRQHPSVYMSPAPATLERSLTSTLISALYTIFGVILTYRSVSALPASSALPNHIRSITTSHKLQSFHPKQSLDALITPCERRKPWVLLTPGLLPALLTGILLRVLVLRPLFGLVRLDKPVDGITVELMAYMVVKISVMSLSTVVLAPLDVIVTRLVLQRNYSDGVDISATAPEGELPAADMVDSVGAEVDIEKAAAKDEEFILEDSGAEPAIRYLYKYSFLSLIVLKGHRYRSDKEVYTGLINCVQTISREEGWGVLYRMWWLTLLGTWVV